MGWEVRGLADGRRSTCKSPGVGGSLCGSEGRHVGLGNREWQIMLLDQAGLVNQAKGLGRPRKV